MSVATRSQDALIAGEWIPGGAGSFEVRSPWDGSLVGVSARCDAADVDRAVAAARRAQPGWAATPLLARVELFDRAMEIAEGRNEAIARMITAEMGKTIRESREEMVEFATPHFRRAAEDALRYRGMVLPSTQEHTTAKRILATRRPVGVVGVISPFNFPVDIAAITLTYSIVAGNAVVWKPSELTPLCCGLLAEVFHQAGLPAGVLNFVPGESDVGEALVAHPGVAAISFTGSTRVGEAITRNAGVKRLLLELGGNGPQIVLADADLDRAADAAVTGCFYMAGQVCTAAERILVHEDVHDAFVAKLIERARALRLGDPAEEDTDMGPLVNRAMLERVEGHVEAARRDGAEVVQVAESDGLLYPPTILTGVTPAMAIAREETFGPVAPVIPFRSTDEAIAIANDSPYALNAAAFTNDLRAAWRFAEELDHGTVLINETTNYWDQLAPFGGAKQSGLGRELSTWMLDSVTECKTIVFDLSEASEIVHEPGVRGA